MQTLPPEADNALRCGHPVSVRTVLLLFCVGWCLFACGPRAKPDGVAREGGVLYYGVEVPFQGFDVLKTGALNPPLSPLFNLLLEPLFRMDREGRLIPVLGLSATASEEGTTWEIRLREGVAFHDGTPFNADAVLHHWSRMIGPEANFLGRRILAPLRSIEKVGDHSVRFHLNHPWPPFLNVLSNDLLLLAFIPSPKAVDAGTHDRKPVGTGPFRYGKWDSGDHFAVYKNADYWQVDKPFLNKVVFRTIPDHQTRYAGLVSGELDVISIDRGPLIHKAQADPLLTVYPSRINGAEIILFNTTQPPLDDIRVRRALALANSQERHVNMVYGGTVPLVHHPIGEGVTCEDDAYPAFDPEEAKRLLADYGQPVAVECLHSNTSRGSSIGALQQQLYKAIGVDLAPVGISPGPHMMKVVQKDYQLATWRIPPTKDFGPKFYAKFHSRSPGNFTGYASPEMDRLLEAQRVETDAARRKALLCRIVRQLNRDVPIIYRGGRRYHTITRKKLRGMTDAPGFTIDLASAWLDEVVKFNTAALKIEKNAATAKLAEFDCPDPGDVAAVKRVLLGAWKGKDSWGATISMNFRADDKVDLKRTGGPGNTGTYRICTPKVYIQGRAAIVMQPVSDKLEGVWRKDQYSGEITLERAD